VQVSTKQQWADSIMHKMADIDRLTQPIGVEFPAHLEAEIRADAAFTPLAQDEQAVCDGHIGWCKGVAIVMCASIALGSSREGMSR
jgi:hypothetical protein